MFSEFAASASQFDKGDLVTHAARGLSGIVVAVFFNQFSSQYVYTVRCPQYPVTVLWCEGAVVASQSAEGIIAGDMVIAHDDNGHRHMGEVVGKTFSGELIARFAIGTHVVALTRVWRAWPFAQNTAVAA
jgi:hypothetical protein